MTRRFDPRSAAAFLTATTRSAARQAANADQPPAQPPATVPTPVQAPAPTRAGLSPACAIMQSSDPAVLAMIGQPDIAAVVWQRALPPALTEGLAALPADQLPALRVQVPLAQVGPQVQAACRASGLGDAGIRQALADDIATLAQALAGVTGQTRLTLRLDPVSTDACRRFHIDNVRARLLCTYRGQGTQLAAPGRDATPDQLPTGAAAILRGARWPGAQATGLRHRSPPIAGSGETRLLLVIDPAGPEDMPPH
ncbi:DUF1826 domain-containing protein [Paracoccus jiaweipingae]|uniref:DUF1826 domain-containing protein n=1 Tax=unclassified Paracoccus (in: a-proteobacteria) TaxID=2688777 RepID=UPI0037B242BE